MTAAVWMVAVVVTGGGRGMGNPVFNRVAEDEAFMEASGESSAFDVDGSGEKYAGLSTLEVDRSSSRVVVVVVDDE